MRAVSDLKFRIGANDYTFAPEYALHDDLPRLMLLFMALTQPLGRFDIEGYMDEHSLWYCFETA